MTSLKNYFYNPRNRHILEWVLLVVLVAIVAATLYFVVRNFETLRLRGQIRPMRNHQQILAQPDQIQSWMTFRYLNMVFHLAPNYFKTVLSITDAHYPNISISALAKQRHETVDVELAKVISAIKNPK